MRNYTRFSCFFGLLIFFGGISSTPVFAQAADHIPGEILIQIKPGTSAYDLARRWDGLFPGARIAVKKSVSPPLDIWLIGFRPEVTGEQAFLDFLRRENDILHAQFNHLIADRQTIPDDPEFDLQWQWLNTGATGTADADVDADLAWDLATGGTTTEGQEVVICIIESNGADWDHPDLADNHWVNTHEIPGNGLDDDGNGYVDDYNGWNVPQENDLIPAGGHGTSVSGMAGARGNNQTGISGINWQVKLMQVVRGGLGNATIPNEANVLAAYTYPLVMRQLYNETNGQKGAFVVVTNASWGLDNGQAANAPLWCEMYNELGNAGILSCAATANDETVNVDVQGDLPTACPSDFLIAVTSSDANDERKAAYGLTHIDVAAPGESVRTTNTGGGYGFETGTSFASPLVAGLVALIYATDCPALGAGAISDPATTALLVRDYILNGVDPQPGLAGFIGTGGRVNAFQSLQLALAGCDPCPTPYGVTTAALIDTTATLIWSVAGDISKTDLRWRKLGAPAWQVVSDAQSPFVLSGLEACTDYEVQWKNDCATDWGADFVFKTDGCCEAPADVQITATGNLAVTVEWTPVLAAESYKILFWEAGVMTTLPAGTQTTFQLNDLEACTDYAVAIGTQCAGGQFIAGDPIAFSTPGCGACLDAEYCPAFSANSSNEWIALVQLAGLNNATGSDFGYGDYTGLPVELETYQIYDLHIHPGFSGFGFNEYFKVWIDFDQNGAFDEPAELVFDPGGTTNQPVSGQIVIPPDAQPGLTRMRVIMRFSEPPTPCDEGFNFGEVEDYCVLIVPGTPPDCATPDAPEVSNISYHSAELNWLPTDNALAYQVRISNDGGATWSEFSTPTPNFMPDALADCQTYEVQVQTQCPGTESAWSESTVFTTLCAVPCEEIPANPDTLDVSFAFADIAWHATPNATAYRLRYRPEGQSDWSFLTLSDTLVQIPGLTDCQVYEYGVQALCPGAESDFSATKTFKTDCISGLYPMPEVFFRFALAPNPFGEAFAMDFALREKTTLTIRLFDATGRPVLTQTRTFPAGEFKQALTLPDASPNGLYFLWVETEGGHFVQKIIRLR
ncbi:MAG: T9SS C-terminal target domain-containing protein [Bacteroidetes bacterium]|nr:MAG: T9SS C-terminal target domain-containing protein [Bacteroidota bacterium]